MRVFPRALAATGIVAAAIFGMAAAADAHAGTVTVGCDSATVNLHSFKPNSTAAITVTVTGATAYGTVQDVTFSEEGTATFTVSYPPANGTTNVDVSWTVHDGGQASGSNTDESCVPPPTTTTTVTVPPTTAPPTVPPVTSPPATPPASPPPASTLPRTGAGEVLAWVAIVGAVMVLVGIAVGKTIKRTGDDR